MADEDNDKPISEIELEDGEIEEDEVEITTLNDPSTQIVISDSDEKINQDVVKDINDPDSGGDRQQSFRKRHMDDDDESSGWKKTRTDSIDDGCKSPLDTSETVKESWGGYNSDEEKETKKSPIAKDEVVKSPVETAKWGYDSDDEVAAQTVKPASSSWGNDDNEKKDEGSSWSNNKSWGDSNNDSGNNNSWGNRGDSYNNNRNWGNRNNDDNDDQRGYGRNNDRRGRGRGRGRFNNDRGFNNRGGGRGGRFNNDRGFNNNRNDDNGGYNRSNSGWGNSNDDDNNSRGNSGWGNNNDDNGGFKRNNSGWGNNDDNNNRGNSGWGNNDDNNNRGNSGWGSNNDDNGNSKRDNSGWGNVNEESSTNKGFGSEKKSREPSVEKWGGYDSGNDDKVQNSKKDSEPIAPSSSTDKELPLSPVEKSAWAYNSDDDDDAGTAAKASSVIKEPHESVNRFSDSPVKSGGDKWGAVSDDENFGGWNKGESSNTGAKKPDNDAGTSKWGGESPNNAGTSKWGNESPVKSSWGNESPVKSSWGNDNDNNNRAGGGGWGNDNDSNNRGGGGGWGKDNDNNNRPSWGGGGGNNNNNNTRSYGGKRGVCKYFQMGSCRHGDNCKFLHENPGDSNGSDNNNRSSGFNQNSGGGGGGNNSYGNHNNNQNNHHNHSGGSFDRQGSNSHKPEATLKELCKFYEHHQCYKRSSCAYMHEEFPCKLYHAGSKMCPSGDSCKYSHAPLNDVTKDVLDKYLNDKGDDKGGFDSRSMGEDPSHMKDGMMDDQHRNMMSMYGPAGGMMPGPNQRCMPMQPNPMMHPQWPANHPPGNRPPWSNVPHMMPPYQNMNPHNRFMMDRFNSVGGGPGPMMGQFPQQMQGPSGGPRMSPNQVFSPHRPPIRNLMMLTPNGMSPYGMPPVGPGGSSFIPPQLPLLNNSIPLDESSKDGSTMQSQRQPQTDAYLDNLAHLVVSKQDNIKNNTNNNNSNSSNSSAVASTHKRLVDILDPNSLPDDIDDFNNPCKSLDKSQLTPSATASQISPIRTKSPEIAPGSYIPNNSLNAAVPNVRLNGDANMMYNGGVSGNNGTTQAETAMMDYINMSAFYYNPVPDPNQPHNPHNQQHMHHSNPNMMEREWKLLPLEFSQKVPYPLMMIDTSDVLNKFIDPRLQGHPSVMNPTGSGSSGNPPGTGPQTTVNTVGNDLGSSIKPSAGMEPTSVEIIDMTSGPDESPTYTTQISGNSAGTAESIESPLISPSSDIGGAGGFPFSASVGNTTPISVADINRSAATPNAAGIANARAYLQDPRFKRKKVASTPTSVTNTSIETVELD